MCLSNLASPILVEEGATNNYEIAQDRLQERKAVSLSEAASPSPLHTTTCLGVMHVCSLTILEDILEYKSAQHLKHALRWHQEITYM